MEEVKRQIESALRRIAENCGFTLPDIYGSRRNTELVFIRLAIIDLLRSYGYTYREIGRIINRDKTVAIRGKERADALSSIGDNMYLKVRKIVERYLSFLHEGA